MTFTGNIDAGTLDLTSNKGSISLVGTVRGGTLGSNLVANAPEGNISVDGAGNDIFAIAGVTYKDEFRLKDTRNNFSVFGAVTGLGANPTAVIDVFNGNLTLDTATSKFTFSNGGRLELGARDIGNPASGNLDLGAAPINVGSAAVSLTATSKIEGLADITAKTLDVSAGTARFEGNITATQRLDANAAGDMNFTRNVSSERLTLNSLGGSISAISPVNTNLFVSNTPGGDVRLLNSANNILSIGDVTFDRNFTLETSSIGLAISGKVTGGPVSKATIVASNGGINLVSGSRITVSGNGGLLRLVGNSFANFSDTNALVANNGARWLIYTPSPDVTSLGALVPDFRPVFGVAWPTVVPNTPPTNGSRAVHASADPAGGGGGPDLTAATRVGGYSVANFMEGYPPKLAPVAGVVTMNPIQAAIASAHSEVREALAAAAPSWGTLTDAALNAMINAGTRAGELGLPYQIRRPAPGLREGPVIAQRLGAGADALMTVVMDDGRIFNVPRGGRVASDGDGGFKVLSAEDPVAVELGRGRGSLIIAGQVADGKPDPTGSINYQDSDRTVADSIINRKVDVVLATQFIKRVTLSDGRVVKVSTFPQGTLAAQSGLGGFVDSLEMAAMAKASGLSLADVNAMVAAGGGNLTPGVVAAMVAAGGGNMNGQRIASMVAAGGGNMVAAGAGNFLSASAVAQIFNAMVAAGAGNMVAAGGMNFAPQAVQSLVAAGGLNLTAREVATLIGNDGSTLIGNDGSTLIGNDGSTLIGLDGSTLIGLDGSTLIGNDGSTLIGLDGSTLIGLDGSTMIGDAGSTLINRVTASLVAAGGLNLVAAGGLNLVAAGGLNLVAAGGMNLNAIRAGELVNSGSFGGSLGTFGGFK
jgi:hypothetical protein